MKHTLLIRKSILLIFLLASAAAFSQMRGGAKQTLFWAGPKIGMNISNFYSDSTNPYNQYKIDFMGGASVNFSFNSNLSVGTEFNYSPKGGKYKFHTDTSSIRQSYSLTYLDVPLLVQVKGGEEDVSVFFQLGAQKSFLLNAEYSEKKTYGAVSSSLSDSDVKSLGVPKSDFGFLAGFGFISEYGWCFTLRANIGMTDIPDHYNKITVRTMAFQASLGYYFGRKYNVIGGKSR